MVNFGGIFRWLFGRRRRSNRTGRIARIGFGGLLEVEVKFVCDGDTVIVLDESTEVKVRLSSIDCPEGDQPWGDIATAGLIKMIGGRHVYLEAYGLDPYGRTLATIYVMDGNELINVNERMVMLGHAWIMPNYMGHLSRHRQHQLARLERWARSKKVGLWNTSDPIPPWLWRGAQKSRTGSNF